MAETEPQSSEYQRELGDLREGGTGGESHAHRVTHHRHDQHDDDRLADQDEGREHQRFDHLPTGIAELESCSEIEKEEQQQEVPQAHQPCTHRIAIRRCRQRDAGDEGTDLGTETEPLGQRCDTHGVGNSEQHQQFLGSRDVTE